MKGLLLAALALNAWVSAAIAKESSYSPVGRTWFRSDWQEPSALPRRFRNHCYFDTARGRYYCSDHCGSDYQIYYCSKKSFGCCHVGRGYCGWDGALRCGP
jgi:hypothetical protein